MTEQERLSILKSNLQRPSSANDALLLHLLRAGEAAMRREGIADDGTIDYENCVIDYAAYLFRRRAGQNTTMPRFLRWNLNNILFSQKGKGISAGAAEEDTESPDISEPTEGTDDTGDSETDAEGTEE